MKYFDRVATERILDLRMRDEQKMNIPQIFQDARRIVEEADLPEHLQEIAFSKAVDLLAREMGLVQRSDEEAAPPGGPAGDLLQRVAQKLGVEATVLRHVYFEEDEELNLEVPSNKLSQASDAAGMRELALLYAAGRQAAGVEEWTSRNAIRSVTQRYGVYNKNFVNEIAKMEDVFIIRQGEGIDKRIKVREPGYDQARQLIQRIAGNEG